MLTQPDQPPSKVNPADLTPLCDEAEFAQEIAELVAEQAPRLFAVVQEYGERADRGRGHGVRGLHRRRQGGSRPTPEPAITRARSAPVQPQPPHHRPRGVGQPCGTGSTRR